VAATIHVGQRRDVEEARTGPARPKILNDAVLYSRTLPTEATTLNQGAFCDELTASAKRLV